MADSIYSVTMRTVNIEMNMNRFIAHTLEHTAIDLVNYIMLISPVDTGLLRRSWQYSYRETPNGGIANLLNDTEYLKYVRGYYIRRLNYDFVDDAISDWTKGKPARERLKPPDFTYDVDYLQISRYPWAIGAYKNDPAYLNGNVFRVRTTAKTRAFVSIEKLREDAAKILEYLQSVSPVKTGLMRASWIYHVDETNKMIIFTNTAKTKDGKYYLCFPRRYYILKRSYDLIKDAVLDFNLGLPLKPTLRPVR